MSGYATTLVPLDEVPRHVFRSPWVAGSVLLQPSWFARASTYGGWRSWAVLAHRRDEIVAVMVVQRARHPSVAAVFDPAHVAPALFQPRDARSYLFVGGVTDLISGTALAPGMVAHAVSIRAALIRAARAEATRTGLVPAALYVRDDELPAFAGLGAARKVTDACAIRLAGSDDAHLATLRSAQRRTVVQDRLRIAAAALTSHVLPAVEAIALSALVANVKRRHGVPDHSRLVRMRLAEWAAEPVGERMAFVVSRPTGPLAVTYACRIADRLELYELGLADDAEHRHDAYLESLIHAPVRFCLEHAIAEVQLGLDAVRPKTWRGAVARPVWAVGPHPGPRGHTADSHQRESNDAQPTRPVRP